MIVPSQQRLELLLSGHQWQWPQVLAVQLKEIKRPDAEDLPAVVPRVECAEIRGAIFLTGHDLAIDDCAPAR
jgi:hypothetical protein